MANGTTLVLRHLAAAAARDLTDRELLRRFAADDDQSAFALLVARHTSMVFGVCRRATRSAQDAEDACQATFLVLAKRARDGRWHSSIANWLYATARRVAANARIASIRRVRREAAASVPEAFEPIDAMSGRELLSIVDDELHKLPPIYRETLVLCQLEGLSREEAATRLGATAGTVKIRLERGRKRLGDALARRGLGLLAFAVAAPASAAPSRLVQAVLDAVAGSPSATVAALAQGVAVRKSIWAIALLAAAATLGIGVGVGAVPAPAEQPTPKPAPVVPAANERVVAGRVLGPDAMPVAGAVISLGTSEKPGQSAVVELARTDGDGRFRCVVPPAPVVMGSATTLVAHAAGFGPDWVESTSPSDAIDFRLAPPGPPVRGRILTLEGQPVAGATVRIVRIDAADGKTTLKDVYAKLADDPRQATSVLKKRLPHPTAGGLPEALTTGADGRFVLANVGDGRLIVLEIAGDAIERLQVRVALDAAFDPKAVATDATKADATRMPGRTTSSIHGPTFDLAVRPCRPIIGTVSDKATGKPLGNVVVSSHAVGGRGVVAHTRTDANGHYRLLGMANADCRVVFGLADRDWPYLMMEAGVKPTVGIAPATCDMTLVRGTLVVGRVVDMVTDKPIQGAIEYVPLLGNTAVLDLPGRDTHRRGGPAHLLDSAGRFHFVAPQGPGIIMMYADTRQNGQKPYPQVRFREEDKAKPYFRSEGGLGDACLSVDGVVMTLDGRAAYRIIEPDADTGRMEVDFRVNPGSPVVGTVVGPDGKPFVAATIAGLMPAYEEPKILERPSFTALAVVPGEGRPVGAIHIERRLAGLTRVSANADTPPVIALAAWGAVTGRLIDSEGKPIIGATVKLRYGNGPSNQLHHAAIGDKGATTGDDGSFRLDAPFPDRFRLSFARKGKWLNVGRSYDEVEVAAGATKALGDVGVKTDD